MSHGHGNYRTLHWKEAAAEASERDEILVTLAEVLMVNQGSEAAIAMHIVAEPQFWAHDEPKGYCVELVRPRWLYGAEGHLHDLRWVGRVDELTTAEMDAMTVDEDYWDLIPESGSFLWAMPRLTCGDNPKPWQRCELPWFDAFRTPAP